MSAGAAPRADTAAANARTRSHTPKGATHAHPKGATHAHTGGRYS